MMKNYNDSNKNNDNDPAFEIYYTIVDDQMALMQSPTRTEGGADRFILGNK